MRAQGALFEQRACAELKRIGFQLLSQNFTTRHGEIDLVMLDGDCIVFVEVRHRLHGSHGGAAASVTTTKQARLIAAAQLWLVAHPRFAQHACRFDVVSYDGVGDTAQMTHWRSAFESC